MTDFLIVHDVGQGAWFWNKVWGSVTAPEEHPPRLYTPRSSSQFYLLNLPGHGGDEEGDTGEVRLDECIQAITRAVERRGMADLVLVGHGVGGAIAALAAPLLPTPPKRLALVAGVIPSRNRSLLSRLPAVVRNRFFYPPEPGQPLWPRHPPAQVHHHPLLVQWHGTPAKSPAPWVSSAPYLPGCSKTRIDLPLSDLPCPVSYVVLDQDRLLPRQQQVAMARLIPNVDLIHLNACHQASLQTPTQMGQILLSLSNKAPSPSIEEE